MTKVADEDRRFAEELGKLARTQLPQLDWEEAEPHLILGWRTSTHAHRLNWSVVRIFARESWGRADSKL